MNKSRICLINSARTTGLLLRNIISHSYIISYTKMNSRVISRNNETTEESIGTSEENRCLSGKGINFTKCQKNP